MGAEKNISMNKPKEQIRMTPLDLFSRDEWKEILERFAGKVRMAACLGDPAGNPIECRADRYPLCTAIRNDRKSATFICGQASATMSAVVKKTMETELDYCQVGLIRLVVPIVRNGETIGQVFACGLASREEEIDSETVAKQLGISEDEVLEIAKATPFGSEKEIESVAADPFDELNAESIQRG